MTLSRKKTNIRSQKSNVSGIGTKVSGKRSFRGGFAKRKRGNDVAVREESKSLPE